jgi:hypothetical protein
VLSLLSPRSAVVCHRHSAPSPSLFTFFSPRSPSLFGFASASFPSVIMSHRKFEQVGEKKGEQQERQMQREHRAGALVCSASRWDRRRLDWCAGCLLRAGVYRSAPQAKSPARGVRLQRCAGLHNRGLRTGIQHGALLILFLCLASSRFFGVLAPQAYQAPPRSH